VASVQIAGLEPKESHWAGVEWLAERGIHGVPIPWSPTAAWHLEVAARSLDIWEAHGFDADRHSSQGLHYMDLANMRRHLQEAEDRDPAFDRTGDLRHTIAVEGVPPEM
jgi:hypothetical protein